MKELYVGQVYDDPDGTFEITEIGGNTVDVRCIDCKVVENIGKEYRVPKAEALYFCYER